MDLKPPVLEPPDEAGIVAALGTASAEGRRVVVEGGGTRAGLGAPPDRVDLKIRTGGLRGILEHHREDFTVEAWAGTPVAELNRELAPTRQFAPLDPPLPDLATLGGVIAAGETGLRRAPGARPGDLLLGFRAVLGDGALVRSGGRVVKNVTGYELGRLFTGSLGTLGVLTRVALRLRALPEASRSTFLLLPPEGSVEDFVSRVVEAGELLPEAMAVVSPGTGLPGLPDHEGFVLVMRFEGLREEVEAGGDGLLLASPAAERFWAAARDFPVAAPRKLEGHGLRGAGSRTAVLRAASSFATIGPTLALPDVGRAFAVIPPDCLPEALAAAREEDGLSLVVETSPPGMVPGEVFHPHPKAPAAALMRRIRIALDPRDTLAPGRFPWTR